MAKFVLVSLPLSAFDSSDRDSALSSLKSTINRDNGTVLPFSIPEFKIGTLDALVQQADDLAKLEAGSHAVVAKVADSLRTLLDGDEDKLDQQKRVNDKPSEQYVRSFTWNKVRYRTDKSLSELISILQKELANTDNDVKAKFNQYNSVKTNLAALERRQTGNLSTKSLAPIIDPSLLITDSEYLETVLVAVPNNSRKEFIKSYETLSPMVVPRSSVQVAQDDEFALFAVVVFKKHAAEFVQKCRDQKWTPRPFKFVEGGRDEERRELERVARDEKKVWGEALLQARTAWSEAVMVWMHVFALRVFVESVLRYGLPLQYVSAIVQTTSKQSKKIKTALDEVYSYLAAGAFGRDKKGRVTKDDAAMTAEMAAAGLGVGEGHEFTAFVYYEFEL